MWLLLLYWAISTKFFLTRLQAEPEVPRTPVRDFQFTKRCAIYIQASVVLQHPEPPQTMWGEEKIRVGGREGRINTNINVYAMALIPTITVVMCVLLKWLYRVTHKVVNFDLPCIGTELKMTK